MKAVFAETGFVYRAITFTMLTMKIMILMLLALLTACAPINNKTSTAYITNQGDNTVSVVDVHSAKVSHTIKVGKAPVGVAVSHKLNRVFISNVESHDISVINSITNQVIDTINVGGSPVGIALSPNNHALYVADWYSDRILEINTSDYTKRRELVVAKAPAGLVVSLDSKTLFVAARDSNEIAVIDAATFTITKRIATGKHPFGVSLGGDYLYIVNVYENSVSIIHTKTWAQSKIKVGEHPYCAVASPNNKTLYVTNTQDDTVSIIDLATQKTLTTIEVGSTPEGISYALQGALVLVASWGENKISVIDANTNTLKGHIKTGDKSRAFGEFVLTEQ